MVSRCLARGLGYILFVLERDLGEGIVGISQTLLDMAQTGAILSLVLPLALRLFFCQLSEMLFIANARHLENLKSRC